MTDEPDFPTLRGQFPCKPIPTRHYAIVPISTNQTQVMDFFGRHTNMRDHRVCFTSDSLSLESSITGDDGDHWVSHLVCAFGHVLVASNGSVWAVDAEQFWRDYMTFDTGGDPAWPEEEPSVAR